MAALINWRHSSDGKNVDGATLPSGTGVRIVSCRHQYPPSEYAVYREIPKPFWRFWGETELLVTRLLATPPAWNDIGGWQFSTEIWRLPEPDNASGTATFKARTDTGDCQTGRLNSARLWLSEMTQRSATTAGADAQLALPGISFGPKGTREGAVERSWRVQVAADPWVEVSLLQGSEVLEYLVRLEQEHAEQFRDRPALAMGELPPDAATYFVDRPIGDASIRMRLEAGGALDIDVVFPERRDLRAAVCVAVTNLESGERFVSAPTFATSLQDKVTLTDLTIDLLRGEARDVLQAFDEADLNLGLLADRLGVAADDAWRRLVEAADELGADSITDAARFAGLATPAFA